MSGRDSHAPRDDVEPDAGRPPTNIDDGREGNGLTSYFFIGLLVAGTGMEMPTNRLNTSRHRAIVHAWK